MSNYDVSNLVKVKEIKNSKLVKLMKDEAEICFVLKGKKSEYQNYYIEEEIENTSSSTFKSIYVYNGKNTTFNNSDTSISMTCYILESLNTLNLTKCTDSNNFIGFLLSSNLPLKFDLVDSSIPIKNFQIISESNSLDYSMEIEFEDGYMPSQDASISIYIDVLDENEYSISTYELDVNIYVDSTSPKGE